MSVVSPVHPSPTTINHGGASSSIPIDDILNLDMTTTVGGAGIEYLTDLFSSPHMSDTASPSSATTFLPPTTPPLHPDQPQTALDSIDISNHAVFTDLYRTYIEPLSQSSKALYPEASPLMQQPAAPEPLEAGAFSFNDLFASYAAAATANNSGIVVGPAGAYTAAQAQPALVGSLHPLLASQSSMMSAAGGAKFPFTIDPQLVASPTTATTTNVNPSPALPTVSAAGIPVFTGGKTAPRAQSTSLFDEDDDEDEDDEDDEEENMVPTGAKGKGGAKSKKLDAGVAKGGIVKRTGATSCVVRDPDSNDPDDWRPSPEEYKKLSSKEKRQLRNKISARNFRVRRKEYITTLENQISDRDKLISAIREELGAQQLANNELRQEIDALKKAMLEGRHGHPAGLPPPTPLSALSTTITTKPTTRKSALLKANPNKDVAPGSPGFWGGQRSIGMGGITPVHSAFSILPDGGANLVSVLSGKGGAAPQITVQAPPPTSGPGARWLALQENINPNMNVTRKGSSSLGSGSESSGSSPLLSPSSPSSSSSVPSPTTPPLRLIDQIQPNLNLNSNGQAWTGYSDINPFTIKTLDSYRLQLWAKVAADSAQQQQQQQQQAAQQQQQQNLFNVYSSSSLSGGLKPHFFTTSKDANKENVAPKSGAGSPTLSAVLAGKTVSALSSPSSSHSPPSPLVLPSSLPSSSTSSVPPAVTTIAASAVSSSIMSRMTGAFWDAFSSSSSSLSSPRAKSWDMDKVRKVLEGKAVLKVVDVDGNAGSGLGLEERMGALSLGGAMVEKRGVGVGGLIRKDSWNRVEAEKKTILG